MVIWFWWYLVGIKLLCRGCIGEYRVFWVFICVRLGCCLFIVFCVWLVCLLFVINELFDCLGILFNGIIDWVVSVKMVVFEVGEVV